MHVHVRRHVPADLRARILEYYEYKMTSTRSLADVALLREMPPNLAAQLALSVNRRIVASGASFFRDLSDASLILLLESLVPLVLVPHQVHAHLHVHLHVHVPLCVHVHAHAYVHVPRQLLLSEGLPLRDVYFLNRGYVHLIKSLGTPLETLVRTVSDSESIGAPLPFRPPCGRPLPPSPEACNEPSVPLSRPPSGCRSR